MSIWGKGKNAPISQSRTDLLAAALPSTDIIDVSNYDNWRTSYEAWYRKHSPEALLTSVARGTSVLHRLALKMLTKKLNKSYEVSQLIRQIKPGADNRAIMVDDDLLSQALSKLKTLIYEQINPSLDSEDDDDSNATLLIDTLLDEFLLFTTDKTRKKAVEICGLFVSGNSIYMNLPAFLGVVLRQREDVTSHNLLYNITTHPPLQGTDGRVYVHIMEMKGAPVILYHRLTDLVAFLKFAVQSYSALLEIDREYFFAFVSDADLPEILSFYKYDQDIDPKDHYWFKRTADSKWYPMNWIPFANSRDSVEIVEGVIREFRMQREIDNPITRVPDRVVNTPFSSQSVATEVTLSPFSKSLD